MPIWQHAECSMQITFIEELRRTRFEMTVYAVRLRAGVGKRYFNLNLQQIQVSKEYKIQSSLYLRYLSTPKNPIFLLSNPEKFYHIVTFLTSCDYIIFLG